MDNDESIAVVDVGESNDNPWVGIYNASPSSLEEHSQHNY